MKKYIFLLFGIFQLFYVIAANAQPLFTITKITEARFKVEISNVGNWDLYEQNGANWSDVVRGGYAGTYNNDFDRPAGRYVFKLINSYPNFSGQQEYISEVTLSGTPPLSPTNFTAVLGNASVDLSWTPSSGATSYYLSRDGYSITGYKDTSPTAGANNTYKVVACNNGGACSTPATTTIYYPAVPVISSFNAVPSGTSVSLTWDVSNASTLQLLRNSNPITLTNTDSGLSSGNYNYLLKACNAANVCVSATKDVTIVAPTAPATPTNFKAVLGTAQVVLSWDLSNGATRYELKKSGNLISSPDSSPTAGATNYYEVTACNATQCSVPAQTSIFYPAVPVISSFSAIPSGTSVSLSWNVSSGATLQLYRNSNPIALTSTDSGLSPGDYTYELKACNAANVCSYASKGVTIVPALAVPAKPSVTTTLNGATATITWSSPGAASYQVRRDDLGLSVTGTTYNDNKLLTNTTHVYKVKACNANGECSQEGIGYVVVPSGPRYELIINNPNRFSVVAANVGNWHIELSKDGGYTWTPINNPNNGPSAPAGTVQADYYYAAGTYLYHFVNVYPYQGAGSTTSSDKTLTLLGDTPPTLTSVTAVLNGVTTTVKWASSDATSYKVKRDGENLSVLGTTYKDDRLIPGARHTYTVAACKSIDLCSEEKSAFVDVPLGPRFELMTPVGSNDFTILAANVYNWRPELSSDNGATWITNFAYGPIPAGSSVVQQTYSYKGGNYIYRMVNTYQGSATTYSATNTLSLVGSPPATPTFLAPVVSTSSIALSWSAPSRAAYYNLTRSGGASVKLTGTLYTDTNVTAGSVYTYMVTACNSFDECSAPASKITGLPPVAPTLQANLGTASVILSWNAPNGAASYQLKRETTFLSSSGSPYSDTSCVAGVTYNYSIVACNSNGQCSEPYIKPATCPTVSTSSSSKSSSSISSSSSSARSIGPIKYYYDALGRVVKVEDTLNGIRNYTYDPAGNRTQLNVQPVSSSSSRASASSSSQSSR